VIPYGHQSIDDDDIAAVVRVLKGEWLTQGPDVAEFEAALATATDARHAVAFSSGTAALHAAAAAADLGPGDLVVTSALTFVASANCARYVGATPGVVDIDPETLNLDPRLVPRDATALVAVHYAGLPIDLSSLDHRPQVVIEDAAHALGAQTPDGPVGNCAYSDMCVFSFHPVKAVTTGEGGAVTTNSRHLADRLRTFRNHDIRRNVEKGSWYYEVTDLGYNFRLTDIQAALGTSQLAKLDLFIARRNEIAERYRRELNDGPWLLPPSAGVGWRHAYHLFALRVDRRREVYDRMRERGVGVQVHYVPLTRHPALVAAGIDPKACPAADAAYECLLSLPIFPSLTANDQELVIQAFLDAA
jgi:dTDP-4-amino-4,6-dideoxygalactose transaminase